MMKSSKSKQVVKVKIHSQDPNAILVCKGQSNRAEGWIGGTFDGVSSTMRSKGNYQFIDVELVPGLPTRVYTSRSLVNFTKKYIGENIDDRVFLMTLEAFEKCKRQTNLNPDGSTQQSLQSADPYVLLCIIMFFWPALFCMFNTVTPFKWANQLWKTESKSPRLHRDLKFVLVQDNEDMLEEQALPSPYKPHSSSNKYSSNMPTTVTKTEQIFSDGSKRIKTMTTYPDGTTSTLIEDVRNLH